MKLIKSPIDVLVDESISFTFTAPPSVYTVESPCNHDDTDDEQAFDAYYNQGIDERTKLCTLVDNLAKRLIARRTMQHHFICGCATDNYCLTDVVIELVEKRIEEIKNA